LAPVGSFRKLEVEGWDGHVLWLKASESEVKGNYERDKIPDPFRYYIKDYPYYNTAYYPQLTIIPSRSSSRSIMILY